MKQGRKEKKERILGTETKLRSLLGGGPVRDNSRPGDARGDGSLPGLERGKTQFREATGGNTFRQRGGPTLGYRPRKLPAELLSSFGLMSSQSRIAMKPVQYFA
jgi:hypothetical protein